MFDVILVMLFITALSSVCSAAGLALVYGLIRLLNFFRTTRNKTL